ncbi:MAG: CBS domain-containing protein [Anaerolineae bacterium]|nr:MAG: CBS domain-containing protein [Anaerolineae bacterium]
MHILLTHEQTDFDGLASLLGAALLQPGAVPLLPHRLNRNVRAYLTLYGLELPFIEPTDQPRGRVEAITLVDTQSLTSVKGAEAETEIRAIDHHEPRPDLPKNWRLTYEPTGACTTIFVEGVQGGDVHLSPPQATLLLLGIYEDTGGLTYTRTTPRDVRAAAWLLEQGASLQVAQKFLNHPLTTAQQAIYDRLRQQAETHVINGHSLILAQTDASETDEELSTIAHKLRDLLDPDGLILLVQTASGVQLIGRATTDNIHMDRLMEQFGGGGHPRAAAALVRATALSDVYDEVLNALPHHVQPAVTVAEIMSRRPQLLDPDTQVKEVAAQMQRYGYEGYPVVERGKVVGLLTRRAVDRAISHRLNLRVREVMSSGDHHVTPQDSIESLQRVMTESGWGQIPVLEGGEVVGIVTRTDLLKMLMPQTAGSGRPNLEARLEAGLPSARLALLKAVAHTAREQGDALYIVGGFVRDLLLDHPSLDMDLVVEGDAIALADALAKRYGGKVTSHKRFGTAKWQLAGIAAELATALSLKDEPAMDPATLPDSLDLVSARREFYTHPTALPTVERGSIKLDLHRRDFTINTLALRLDGHHYGDLLDFWGGMQDLKDGIVRVLHSLSFVDDPTRMLRAVRFEQRFGYQISNRTQELLQNALPLLDRVSGDRLRHELGAILHEPNWDRMLARLAKLEVLDAVHPALVFDAAAKKRVALALGAQPGPQWELAAHHDSMPLPEALTYVVWMLERPSVEAASMAGRLRLPGWLTKALLAANRLLPKLDTLADGPASAAVAALDEAPPLALYALHLAGSKAARGMLETYIGKWRAVQPLTTGHDLRARGIPAGPLYRQVLLALRAAWLDGEVTDEAGERAKLDELLND